MDREWVAQKEKKYTEDLQQRKQKIHDFIIKSELIDADDKENLMRYLNDAEKSPWSTMLDWKLRNCLIEKMADGKEIAGEDIVTFETAIKELEIDKYYSRLQYPEAYSCKRYLDSEPVEFDGDIIITDPCYIMKKRDESTRPKWDDFHPYKRIYDYPDYDEKTKTSKMFSENMSKLDKADAIWQKENPDDWDVCNYGSNMEAIGIHNYMTRDTLYGDWSCTTFNSDTQKEIGEFCADAGLVSVFLLDEVLKYNPDFDYHKEKSWTTTLIKNFKGTVQFVVVYTEGVYEESTEYHKKGEKWEDYSVEVVGHGINKETGEPINFVGKQTGF